MGCTQTWHWFTPAHVSPLSQNYRAHLITLPTHSRWPKARPKTEFRLTWLRSAGKCHRKWSWLEAFEIREGSSLRTTLQQAGMATTADFMTLQQQLRKDIADFLQGVREEMHTAINGRPMQSAASPVPCRGSQQVWQKQPSRAKSAI